ncbi:single-stranded DNA-binding protein 3-like isoform X2 [Arapaima gigas]
MYAKGKGAVVPSDSQAREKLALYVYEYLLHVGAQKSAQTFLSEIRWEKNITLGEPPGFLHSWWCVFWDLYCAAPDRRETCEHSSEAKAFHDYVSNSLPYCWHDIGRWGINHVFIGVGDFAPFMSPRYPGGPRPSLRMPNQPPVGVPGSQPLLPNSLDPTRPQGHPNMGGPMRMNPPRGMGGMGPQVRSTPDISPMQCVLGHVILLHLAELKLSFLQFPMGPGPDGPMGGMGAMEPHHMNGSLGMNNPPGTPRDDGEMAGNFLNPFQSESVSRQPCKPPIPSNPCSGIACTVMAWKAPSSSHS